MSGDGREPHAEELLRRAGIDERREDRGAPNGFERRASPFDGLETTHRQVKALAGIVVGAMAILGGLSAYGVVNNPLETKAHAADIRAAQDKRDDDQDLQIKTVTNRLDGMERTGLLSLQLQIQGRIADLTRESKGLPENGGAARALEETKLQLQQQLEEVRRTLRR